MKKHAPVQKPEQTPQNTLNFKGVFNAESSIYSVYQAYTLDAVKLPPLPIELSGVTQGESA
jgi:hypothetical protein